MLNSAVVGVTDLDTPTRQAMYALFQRYYQATSLEQFQLDLADKDTVILVRSSSGQLCGFSTLAVSEAQVHGELLRFVFSGDTIIDRPYWGSQAFAFAWIRHIGKITLSQPELPLYWLLIVKGQRTFRYLSAFGLRFVPDWRGPDDARLNTIKHELARARFGRAYDEATGLVRFEQSRGHLSPEWAGVSERELSRPDVRFFLERNPGYVRGDELVCLCELSKDNMRPLTRRIFEQGLGS